MSSSLVYDEWREDPAIKSQLIEAVETLNYSYHFEDEESESTVVSLLQCDEYDASCWEINPKSDLENSSNDEENRKHNIPEKSCKNQDFSYLGQNDRQYHYPRPTFGSAYTAPSPYQRDEKKKQDNLQVPDMETVLEILQSDVDMDIKQEVVEVFRAVATSSVLEVFNHRLQSLISTQSILTNVNQWKKENEKQNQSKIEDDSWLETEFLYEVVDDSRFEVDSGIEDVSGNEGDTEDEGEEKLLKTDFFYLECLEEH